MLVLVTGGTGVIGQATVTSLLERGHSEPGTGDRVPDLGETITMALPIRGTIQVRVQELTDRVMTFSTLEGHPIAGAVRFLAEARGPQIRYEGVQSESSSLDQEQAKRIEEWLDDLVKARKREESTIA